MDPVAPKAEPTIDQVQAAVILLDANGARSTAPAKGQKYTVKRGPGLRTLPIQYILNRLAAAYPESTFTFSM